MPSSTSWNRGPNGWWQWRNGAWQWQDHEWNDGGWMQAWTDAAAAVAAAAGAAHVPDGAQDEAAGAEEAAAAAAAADEARLGVAADTGPTDEAAVAAEVGTTDEAAVAAEVGTTDEAAVTPVVQTPDTDPGLRTLGPTVCPIGRTKSITLCLDREVDALACFYQHEPSSPPPGYEHCKCWNDQSCRRERRHKHNCPVKGRPWSTLRGGVCGLAVPVNSPATPVTPTHTTTTRTVPRNFQPSSLLH